MTYEIEMVDTRGRRELISQVPNEATLRSEIAASSVVDVEQLSCNVGGEVPRRDGGVVRFGPLC
jgi:hypothetical protein